MGCASTAAAAAASAVLPRRPFPHMPLFRGQPLTLPPYAPVPCSPADPSPMPLFRGQPLTHQLAEDLFIGWLDQPGQGAPRGAALEPGMAGKPFSWLVAAGACVCGGGGQYIISVGPRRNVRAHMLTGWRARQLSAGVRLAPQQVLVAALLLLLLWTSAGKNPAYDYFPCQHQLYYRGKGKGQLW